MGAAGGTLIVTEVVPAVPVHPLAEAVTEYVPEAKVVTLNIAGFCEVEVNPLGPLQLYVVPVLLAVKLNVCPEHTVLLLPAIGAAGVAFIVTLVVPAVPVHPFSVAVTEYVPVAARVTLTIVGF